MKTWKNCQQKLLIIGPIFFSIANRPKTSPSLIFLFHKNVSLRNFYTKWLWSGTFHSPLREIFLSSSIQLHMQCWRIFYPVVWLLHCLTIAWRLHYLTTASWMPDKSLVTAWQLSTNCLTTDFAFGDNKTMMTTTITTIIFR